LDAADELRYVVKLEVQAVMEPMDVDEVEEDRDHLLEIQEILERLTDDDSDEMGDEIYQRRRFDLCADCYRQYIRNPLGALELPSHIGFSNN
jgi:hypothetical protein